MIPTAQAAAKFLDSQRIAVTGVSRNPQGHGSNAVYGRLKERGLNPIAINPNAETIDGDPCYPNLASVPGGVEAVVIGTRPEHADTTMKECVELGINQVWMHRMSGAGSVSPTATAYGREHGVTVIDGGCPLMYGKTSDGFHRVICKLQTLFGKVPRQV